MTELVILLIATAGLIGVTTLLLRRREQRIRARAAALEERHGVEAEGALADAVTELRAVAARVVAERRAERRIEMKKLRLEAERLERSQ